MDNIFNFFSRHFNITQNELRIIALDVAVVAAAILIILTVVIYIKSLFSLVANAKKEEETTSTTITSPKKENPFGLILDLTSRNVSEFKITQALIIRFDKSPKQLFQMIDAVQKFIYLCKSTLSESNQRRALKELAKGEASKAIALLQKSGKKVDNIAELFEDIGDDASSKTISVDLSEQEKDVLEFIETVQLENIDDTVDRILKNANIGGAQV